MRLVWKRIRENNVREGTKKYNFPSRQLSSSSTEECLMRKVNRMKVADLSYTECGRGEVCDDSRGILLRPNASRDRRDARKKIKIIIGNGGRASRVKKRLVKNDFCTRARSSPSIDRFVLEKYYYRCIVRTYCRGPITKNIVSYRNVDDANVARSSTSPLSVSFHKRSRGDVRRSWDHSEYVGDASSSSPSTSSLVETV
jgi:hypothetical protein